MPLQQKLLLFSSRTLRASFSDCIFTTMAHKMICILICILILQLNVLEATLNLPSIETGESKHSKTKSATARHVTNIPWTVFLVFLLWTMISSKMFPTSPITKTVIIVTISKFHLKFLSMVTF